jgi:hypothetical protein
MELTIVYNNILYYMPYYIIIHVITQYESSSTVFGEQCVEDIF